MDLKSFGSEKLDDFVSRAENGNLNNNENQTLDDIKAQYGDKVDELINKFSSMDETELMGEIFKIINEQKKAGTFNPEKLKSIAQNIKPLLNSEQGQKLEQLLTFLN